MSDVPEPHDTAPRTVLAGQRTIGYRRFGDGAPIVMLHASPRSSAALLPLGLRLASRFTVFALDTPGFGWSDPLPIPRPDALDYAAAMIEAFDALGLDRVPVYGSHTGAAIAVAAAVSYPQRVACLALDGYAIFSPQEQADSGQLPDTHHATLGWHAPRLALGQGEGPVHRISLVLAGAAGTLASSVGAAARAAAMVQTSSRRATTIATPMPRPSATIIWLGCVRSTCRRSPWPDQTTSYTTASISSPKCLPVSPFAHSAPMMMRGPLP